MRWLPALLLALVGALLAAAVWLLGTESGLRWALARAPAALVVEQPHGALGGEIRARRVAWEGIEAHGVALELHLLSLLADTASVGAVRIDSLDVAPQVSKGEAKGGGLPMRVRVSDARVKSLTFRGYELNDLRLDYAGGPAGHELETFFRAAGASATLKATLDARAWPTSLRAEIQALNLALLDPDYPQTALTVRLEARGDEKQAAGRVSVENPQAGPLDAGRLPLARAEAAFATDFASVSLSELRAALKGSGLLEGRGRVAPAGAELELAVRELDLRAVRSNLARTRLAGSLSLSAEADRQRLRGTLAQDDLAVAAEAERRGDTIEVRSLRARAAGGEATGSGRLKLGKAPAFEADLKLARFDPARFGDYPAGNLNGRISGNGALGAGGSLGGLREGAVTWQIDRSTLLGQPFASRGSARLAGERLSQADAWATLGENRATAKGSFGAPRDALAWTLEIPQLGALRKELGGQLSARGRATGTWRRPEVQLDAAAKSLALPGLTLDSATLKAAGTLDEHAGEVRARNDQLDVTARLKGGWRGGRWSGELLAFENAGPYPLALQAPAPLEVAPGRAALGRFDAKLARGGVTVESLRWEEGRLSSAGVLHGLRALSVLEVLGAHGRFAGDLTLDGEWSLVSAPRLNGRVALRRAGGDLALAGPPEVPLALSRAALEARFVDDRVDGTLDLATGLGTVRAQGRADGLTPQSAASYTAEVELKDLRQLTAPFFTQLRLAGQVGATLRGSGTLGKPLLAGSLRGDGLALEAPPYGLALTSGRLRAELEGDRLRIVEATIAGGEGRLSVRGTLPLRLAEGGAALQWQAEAFRTLNRPDTRLVVSGRGEARFDGRKLGLAGTLRADSGHFEVRASRLPTLDDDVVVAGQTRAENGKRAPLPLDLDLHLDLGERLTVRGYGFDGGVTGDLHLVTNAAGELLAKGRVSAVRARFAAYGQDLEVDPGSLVFDGPLQRPALDITAWRRHQQIEAGVHVTGTIEAPRVELVSNPPVPDAEKLSWLVLGRAPSTASGADLAILQAASGALIGGKNGDVPMQRRLASRFGVDELTVRSSSELATKNSTDPTTNVFAVGKRLSNKLYVSFEQALGATAEYLVKLDYALTPRVSVRGQTGTTSGVGLFYRYAWD